MKLKFKKIFMIVICCVLFFSMFSGCSKKVLEENSGTFGTATEVAPKTQGNISLFTTKIDSFNPLITKNYYMIAFLGIVYEGLFTHDSSSGDQPVLAESYSSSEQNKKYQIVVRKNVKWHNGKSLTLDDIMDTMKYIISNKYNGQYKSLLTNVLKIEKKEKNTILISLRKSDPTFISKLFFPILRSADLKSKNKGSDFVPNGTGPYKFKPDKFGKKVFERNTKWHDKASYIKTIQLKEYNSPNEALGGFLRGEIDVYLSTDNAEIDSVKSGYNQFDSLTNKFDYIKINTIDNNLKNPLLRRAISLALNKKAIVSTYLKNRANVSNIPGVTNSKIDAIFNFDQNESTSLLKDVKWNSRSQIELLVNSESYNRMRISESIKESLSKVGVNLKIIALKPKELNSRVSQKKYQLAYLGFSVPSNYDYRFMLSDIKDDSLTKKAYSWAIDTKPETRDTKFLDFIKETYNSSPFIGLYIYKTDILSNRRIIGEMSQDPRYPYKNISKLSVSY
ncbi:MAG: ABC transporter substrate-binding protein [Bacillota bacterium]